MPGIVIGMRNGGLPIIGCEIVLPTLPTLSADTTRVGIPIRALIDTGATHTNLNRSIIQEAELPSHGTVTTTTVGSDPRQRPTHSCDVIFRGMRIMPPHNPYCFTVKSVAAIDDQLSGFDAILGWDVLEFIELQFGRDDTFVVRLP